MNTNPPKPPKVVVAPEGCREYLTAGKEYPVIEVWDNFDKVRGYGFTIIDDFGDCQMTFENFSHDFKDGNWIIKEREQ